MEESIKNFPEQFLFIPEIIRTEKLASYKRFVVAGMGGSALSAGMLRAWKPEMLIDIHKDYGLPAHIHSYEQKPLVIVSSYSGNTEEALSAFEAAQGKYDIAVITTGGKLQELAEKYQTPIILLPALRIQPRMAIGYSLVALLALMRDAEGIQTLSSLAQSLNPSIVRDQGKALSSWLSGAIPLIYSSTQFFPLAYTWKIIFNETGKTPAFCNALPEANHNEMAGFGIPELSARFRCIVLRGADEHTQIEKRIDLMKDIFASQHVPVQILDLAGSSKIEQLFQSFLLASWAACFTAGRYSKDPEHVTVLEEFKKAL